MNGKLKKFVTSLTLAFTLAAGGGVYRAGAQTNAKTTATTALVAKRGTAKSVAHVALILGQEMPDHSIFAGFTADGKQEIFAMPDDLDVPTGFNNTVKQLAQLNVGKAFGHDDWQIPSEDNLYVLYKNRDQGKLKGTFNEYCCSASDFPGLYWSSTMGRVYPSNVGVVDFSTGDIGWEPRAYYRLSCRPVRLVATP